MADISLVIDVKQNGVTSAVKNTKTLESNVKLLSDAFKRNNLTLGPYTKGLKELAAATGKSYDELRKYAAQIRAAERAAARATAAARAEAKAVREYAEARRRANEEDRRRLSAERAAAAAARSTADANRRLRMEFREGYAAQVALRAAQLRLSQAHRQGIITAEEYQRQLQRLNQTVQQGGRHMNRSGVIVQQTGYQVGDFIVQLQGGTNAFVAFGQQATQVAGTLTMLGGKWILIGSALGVTIPLVTALGAGLMRANVEAETIYNQFGFLEGSVRGLASAFGGAGGVILNVLTTVVENLDVFVTILGVSAVAAAARFIATTQIMGTVVTATQLLFSGMAGAQLVAASATTTLTAAMSRLMVVISAHPIIAAMTAALAAAVFILYRARDASSGYRSSVEGLSDALKELRNNAKEAGIETARIRLGVDTSAQAIAMQRIAELSTQIAEQENLVAESSGHMKRNRESTLEALIKERGEIQKLLEADRERVRLMESATAQSSLDSIISSYDEQYATQIKINDAQESLNEAFRLGLIDQEEMVRIMAQYKELVESTEKAASKIGPALQSAIDQANAFATAMGRARTESLGIGISTVGINAQIAALESGASKAEATARAAAATLRETLSSELGGDVARGTSGNIERQVEARYQSVLERERAQEALNALTNPASSSSGGSSTTIKGTNLEKLREELALMEELRGKTEEYQYVRNKLGEEYANVNYGVIKSLEEQYASTQALIKLEEQREQLMTGVGQSVADGFTAMVEGTMTVKDAFRNMAKEIIKQLWEIFVVQQIVGVVSQAFGVPKAVTDPAVSAMMSTWDGGGYTGSGARSGGMDGKGGFVAMLHPQETVVDHTKGQSTGGGQSVVINQSFNFSANGDDSVKKIIAQAAPQIAQMTQKSMMDQRRRGGSMKSTFG